MAQLRGRNVRRTGAHYDGTLNNYITTVIDTRISEREKQRISDRTMDLYINTAIGFGVMEGSVTEVVGTGLTPIPSPMFKVAGRTAKWADKYVETVTQAWEVFTRDSRFFCDVMRRNSFIRLQQLAYFSWKLSGIGIFQVIRRKEKFKPFDLELLTIDPVRLQTPSDLQSNDRIYDGIEIDEFGKPVAAWIAKPEKMFLYGSVSSANSERIPIWNTKTGLRNLLLVCDTRNISEYRQDSILTPMIKEIRDSQDATDAVIVKYLISNLWTAFMQTNAPPVTNAENIDWQDRMIEFESGTLLWGTSGEMPQVMQSSQQPGQQYELLMRTVLERLGMVTGKGYENLTNQYQASFSAAKANIGKAGIKNNMERLTLIETFCDPVMQAFQLELALKGKTKVSAINSFLSNLYAYTRCEWLPQSEHIIDEFKKANSNKLSLESGQTSYSDIYGKMNKDWKPAMRQVAVEMQEVKKLEEEFDIKLPFYKEK